MATANPFDLLGNDDAEDPSQLIQKIEPKKALAPSAKPAQTKRQSQTKPAAVANLPTKPPPPSQAVREAKSEYTQGGRGGRGSGRGSGGGGGRGYNRDSNNENSYGNVDISGVQIASGEVDTRKTFERRGGYGGPRGPYSAGRRDDFSNGGGEGERPRRAFDRRSGTGQGNEVKREGAGLGNWGAQTDITEVTEEVVDEGEKNLKADKSSGEVAAADGNKETSANETEEKEPEPKEMTLEEYEKILQEKRKALQELKTEERKVDVKEFESMLQLANKKNNDEIFVKLGSSKDKKKELAEKEERAKKSVSINEFLKPAEGERYHGGRGRARGRGAREGYYGAGGEMSNVEAPAIEDPGQFPTLGAK